MPTNDVACQHAERKVVEWVRLPGGGETIVWQCSNPSCAERITETDEP